MDQKPVQLLISVQGEDEEERVYLAELLAYELRQLDEVVSVNPAEGDPLAAGAKGSPVDWSTLVVGFAESTGFAAVVAALGGWLSRDKRRSIKLQVGSNSIDVSGITKEQQEDLINWFKTQTGLHLAS